MQRVRVGVGVEVPELAIMRIAFEERGGNLQAFQVEVATVVQAQSGV